VRARSTSSDYAEIKIKLIFDAAAPAPNFEADRNKPPTAADARRNPIGSPRPA
jgi:hypothetical protein